MTLLFIILLVIIILYSIGKNQKNTQSFPHYKEPPKNKKQADDELRQRILKSVDVKIITTEPTNKSVDGNIIDITGRSFQLPDQGDSKPKVPYWPHQYVYSYWEIEEANKDQRAFYDVFKGNFLKGNYYDLEGNTNYAFILLFDLLNDYDKHKNIDYLEKQIKALANNYPKTRSYGISFLTQKTEAIGDNERALTLISEGSYQAQYGNEEYWKLGARFKSKLNLTEQQVLNLNRIYYSTNNFCSIEACFVEVIKLYLGILDQMQQSYLSEGSNLEKEFLVLTDIIARKHFKYRLGSSNYKYSIESIPSEIYLYVFRYAENIVREQYGHKRRVNMEIPYASEARDAFVATVTSKIGNVIPSLISSINPPDEKTEIELNTQNTTRWKAKFEEVTTSFKGDTKQFVSDITSLAECNHKNPSVENIFYEASKFIAKAHQETALVMYIYYLYYDLKSATFDNKQLTKTIQKNLFKTEAQLTTFEAIVTNFIKDRNLEKALTEVQGVYATKRKKIQLDKTSITEVQKKHSGTVELLNEYLKEDDNITVTTQELNKDEVSFEISSNSHTDNSVYLSVVSFTHTQMETLAFFHKSNFTISLVDFESYSKTKGLFRNQLIESINDACYEVLDDLIIEEDEDVYSMNENYYQKILAK